MVSKAPSQNFSNPSIVLDQKAKQSNVTDRKSIQDLAHQVVTYPHVFGIPDPVSGLLETKLTDAEINFRNNNGHAVSEAELANLLNWMGNKFNLPDYSKTTVAQVRTLRMGSVLASPSFMGTTLSGKEQQHKGDQVRPNLSPLQAMHLLQLMIDQKVLNPIYQDPTIDATEAYKHRRAELSKGAVAKLSLVDARTNARGQEIRAKITSNIEQMSPSDAYAIVDHAFKALRLE